MDPVFSLFFFLNLSIWKSQTTYLVKSSSIFFFFLIFFIYLSLAVLGLRFCARAFSSWRQAGATLHRGARASHYRGPSRCGAQAPDAHAQ